MAELPHKLVAPSARPPPESKSDVVGTALMKRVHGSATLFADGGQSLEDFGAWQKYEICRGVPQKDAVL